jgi:signal transduction histidine kinase
MTDRVAEHSLVSRQTGREAPVAYSDVRSHLQRARIIGGFLLLLITVVTSLFGAHTSFVPHIAATVMLTDATIRLQRDHAPVWSFLVDAVTISLIVAADGGVLAPLVALLAYLLIGTIMLVPQPGTIWVMGTAAMTFSIYAAGIPSMGAFYANTALAVGIWAQMSVLFTAAGLLLLEGANHIRAARNRQATALQAEMRASEMKTEFVSMVSHELRTPLTNISGFADTLNEMWRTLDPGEVDEFIGIIQAEAEHLGNLVDDVLAIPRLETGRLLVDVTDFALRPLAFRIANLIFPADGEKEASVQVSGNVILRADPNRVEQILRNLLGNAHKYGGDRVGIEASQRGESFVIAVTDNGPGIPEDDRERIFEQFEQVSHGDNRTASGFGLGLAVTKKLVETMNGEVWYEPGFPVGARFCFTLPTGNADTTETPSEGDRVHA